MLNSVVIMGRLVKDPELKTTGAGVSFVNFRIAVDRNSKAQDAEKPGTDFIDCVAWRHNAEFIAKYFAKGRMIVIRGALRQRSYTSAAGENRQTVEVEVNEQFFGDSKKTAAPAPAGDFLPLTEEDDQLPF